MKPVDENAMLMLLAQADDSKSTKEKSASSKNNTSSNNSGSSTIDIDESSDDDTNFENEIKEWTHISGEVNKASKTKYGSDQEVQKKTLSVIAQNVVDIDHEVKKFGLNVKYLQLFTSCKI